MKSYLFLSNVAIFLLIIACEAPRSERDDLEADTTAITDGFNTRGQLSEGVYEQEVDTRDSVEANKERAFIPDDLPSNIRNKLNADETYQNKEITHARRMERREGVFYEIAFDHDSEDKIVVDEEGNIIPNP